MKYQPPYGAPGADDPYVNGDPTIARQGSIIPAAAVEYPQREIVDLITRSNFTPTDDDLEQLTRATRSQFVNFCVDTGSANNLSVALNPPLLAYKQGMPLRVLVANANTGPTVINVNGLGGRPLRRPSGSELQPNDIVPGMIASIVDDGTAFQLANFQASGGTGGGGTTNNYYVKIPYVQDSSATPNTITAPFTPAITAVVPGDLILVRVANTNTGAVQIAVNGLAAQPVRRNDGQPLQGRDILVNECILLEWNVTYWQCLRLVRSQVNFKLTANLTLYVRPDGNDNNDGSANDPAHAFRTIAGACEYVKASFVIAGRTVTVQLGVAGSYEGGYTVKDLPGSIIIRGDPANMGAYVVNGPATLVDQLSTVLGASGSGTTVTLSGMTLNAQDPTNGVMLSCVYNAQMYVQDVVFQGVVLHWQHIMIGAGGQVTFGNYIHVYNKSPSFIGMWDSGVEAGAWFTLINTHNTTFTQAFLTANDGFASFTYGYCQFTGGAIGPRYLLTLNSTLYTQGGPADFLPGNSPGTKDATSAVG